MRDFRFTARSLGDVDAKSTNPGPGDSYGLGFKIVVDAGLADELNSPGRLLRRR